MVGEEKSAAYRYFYREFFETSDYMKWHDGVNTDCVLPLEGEERDEAEQLLIQDLKDGGTWSAGGLAKLKSKKALPVLEDLVEKTLGTRQVRIAVAIEHIKGEGKHVQKIIDVLLSGAHWSHKITAAIQLRNFPREDVVEALYEGMLDPDYLVRHHSIESLLSLHGFNPSITEHDGILELLVKNENTSGNRYPGSYHAEAVRLARELFKDRSIQKQ